jgi:hypothetical protein
MAQKVPRNEKDFLAHFPRKSMKYKKRNKMRRFCLIIFRENAVCVMLFLKKATSQFGTGPESGQQWL